MLTKRAFADEAALIARVMFDVLSFAPSPAKLTFQVTTESARPPLPEVDRASRKMPSHAPTTAGASRLMTGEAAEPDAQMRLVALVVNNVTLGAAL